jgi:hypothetical protein
MCRRSVFLWVLAVMLLLVGGSVAAAQDGSGGVVRQPRTDAERRSGNKERPRFRAKVDRRSLRGDLLGRGKRTDKNRDGRFSADECEFDFTVGTDIALGERQMVVVNNPTDCTSKLEEIQDVDVVEPDQNHVAMVTPGVFHTTRKAIGNLWEALFPTVLAQTWLYRELYHDIMTCGVICPPTGTGPSAGDGVTALQGFMDYQYIPFGRLEMTSALGWWCVDGWRINLVTGERNSWCQPPMHLAGAPMFPFWTHWYAYNPIILERIAPGGSFARATDATSFYWLPNGGPKMYDHQLVNWREASNNGFSKCDSRVFGSIVSGPMKFFIDCRVTRR